MAKIYGALEVAQLEWFTDAGKPAASSYIYRVIYVSDLKQVMVSDGSNWIPFLNTSTNQTVNGNITFAGQQIFNGLHRLSVTTDSSSTGAVTALNNVTPVIEFTAAVTSISGIVNSASGATVMLVNRTGGTIAVLDEDTGATAANRIRTGTGAQISLANNASIILTYVGDNRWHIVGGSGSGSGSAGINYITNGSAEADTLGWAVYAESDAVTFQDTGDTVTLNSHGLSNGNQISFTSIVSTTGISTNTLYFVISATTNTFQVATTATGSALPLTTNGSGTMVRFAPKVGTGGSANVTITRTTTTPLVGTASFLLAKDAANRQGQGWSYDFTIDLTNRAKVLQISFDYLVNAGTFVAGATGSNSDVTVWIYDVTNAVVIQPSNIKLFSNNASISDKFQASFQTASNSSNYRLIIHVTSTSASAYTLEVDSVSVSPSDYVFGTPVTDWQSYTPTITHNSGSMTNYTFSALYRRVGDVVDVYFAAVFSGASSAFNGLNITIPNGLAIDTSKLLSSIGGAAARLGSGYMIDPGTGAYSLTVQHNNSGPPSRTVGVFAETASGTYVNAVNIGATVPFTIGSNDQIIFSFSVPITGWSSSVQTSDSADTRVVAAMYSGQVSGTTSTTAPVRWDTRQIDTHGAVTTGVNWKFTAPVSGIYRISCCSAVTSGTAEYAVYKNGVATTSRLMTVISTSVNNGSSTISLVAGDYIDIRPLTGTFTNNAATDYNIAIERLSGPSAIAASESLNATYFSTTGQQFNFGVSSWVDFPTRKFDTHLIYTAPSGTYSAASGAWSVSQPRWTAPISGKYQINASIGTTSGAAGVGEYRSIEIVLNGTTSLKQSTQNSTSYAAYLPTQNISTIIQMNAGDYIQIRYNQQNSVSAARTMGGGESNNYIDIVRVGN